MPVRSCPIGPTEPIARRQPARLVHPPRVGCRVDTFPVRSVEKANISEGQLRFDRQVRDVFVDEVFEVAGLPLVRVPAKSACSPAGLLALSEPHLGGRPSRKIAAACGPVTRITSLPEVRRADGGVSGKERAECGQSFVG